MGSAWLLRPTRKAGTLTMMMAMATQKKNIRSVPRQNAWAWNAQSERATHAMELAKIQAFNKSSDDLVKTLPKFDEASYPRRREKTLSILSMRGCAAVILSGQDPPDTSPDLLAAGSTAQRMASPGKFVGKGG